MPPPVPMPIPQTPGAAQTILSLLASSIGDALIKRPLTTSPVVADQLNQGFAAPAMAQQANREAQGKFQEDRSKKLHELSIKRLDAQVELLERQGKEKEAARAALEAFRLKKDYAEFERTLPPSQTDILLEAGRNRRDTNGKSGVDEEKPITLKDFTIRESEINRKFPSKVMEDDEGKKEMVEDPQLLGSKLDFYVAAMQSKSPGVAVTAARKMGRLVRTSFLLKDVHELGQKLIDLGITDRSVWDPAMRAAGATDKQIKEYLSKAQPQ